MAFFIETPFSSYSNKFYFLLLPCKNLYRQSEEDMNWDYRLEPKAHDLIILRVYYKDEVEAKVREKE